MVFIALALIIKGLLFLHPKPGDGGTKIRVLFQNIDKISVGCRVSFAGKPVGEVESIVVIPHALRDRPKNGEMIYPYELLLSIDSTVRVYESDIITAKTAGLLGERFIEIVPQPGRGKSLLVVSPLKRLYAYEPSTMEDTFKDISALAKKSDIALASLLQFIEKNQGVLTRTLGMVETTVQNTNQFVMSMNKSEVFSESVVTIQEIKKFFSLLNSGQGTLSQLAYNPNLYRQLNSSLEKVDYLVESISSFGLLFHTNSSWQRSNILKKQKERLDLESALDAIELLIKPYREKKDESFSSLIETIDKKIEELKKIDK